MATALNARSDRNVQVSSTFSLFLSPVREQRAGAAQCRIDGGTGIFWEG